MSDKIRKDERKDELTNGWTIRSSYFRQAVNSLCETMTVTEAVPLTHSEHRNFTKDTQCDTKFGSQQLMCRLTYQEGIQFTHALSEEIAHPTVYHHLSQLSVDIQLNGLIKCREDSGVPLTQNKS